MNVKTTLYYQIQHIQHSAEWSFNIQLEEQEVKILLMEGGGFKLSTGSVSKPRTQELEVFDITDPWFVASSQRCQQHKGHLFLSSLPTCSTLFSPSYLWSSLFLLTLAVIQHNLCSYLTLLNRQSPDATCSHPWAGDEVFVCVCDPRVPEPL